MVYYKKFNSGLRLIVNKIEGLYSVSAGIMAGVGSVDESVLENGISHFIEHTTFKGTSKRTSFQVSDDSEFLGSKINAYTSKDNTMYYIKSTTDKVRESFEIISDIYVNAIYPDEELEKEKGVVIEEIDMSEDTPDEVCLDMLSKAFFGDNGYGRPILGTKENVKSFTRDKIFDFKNRYYTADNTVIVFAGNVDEKLAESLVLEFVEGKLPTTKKQSNFEKSTLEFSSIATHKDIEQMHLALAYKGLEYGNNSLDVLNIANIVLGGGMSSRLFQKIREEMGLCYSIFSYASAYRDAGSIAIYAGLNRKMVKQAYFAILSEIENLQKNGVGVKEFERAKNQMLSTLVMAQESTSSLMSLYARRLLALGEVFDLKQGIKFIENISLNDVNELIINNLDVNNFALSIVGRDANLDMLK